MTERQQDNICPICGGILQIAYTFTFEQCLPKTLSHSPMPEGDWHLCPGGHPNMTIQAIQGRFEQVWKQEKKLPTSVTISVCDYDVFFESMWPKPAYAAVSRELLGEERIAELKAQRDNAKTNLRAIVSLVSGTEVPLILDYKMAQGTVHITWDSED